MKRLRLLAGLLGCLAVLAAGLPAVTFAAAPAQTAASEPCDHCPDCKDSTLPAGAGELSGDVHRALTGARSRFHCSTFDHRRRWADG